MAILRSYSATFEQNAFAQAAVARYRFNESSGTDIAVDSVGGFDGEYQTGAAPGAAGFIGDGAATFDGVGGFVLVENTLTGTITVSAFGDSLIAGGEIPDPNNRFSPDLEAALEARGLDATVINEGVGGNTSAQGLGRIADVIDADPDIAIVEFGTNDTVQELSIANVDTNLRAIVTQLQDADIDVLLTGAFGFYPQLNGGTGYAAAEDRDSFEALFPSIASDLGVELLSDSAGSDKFVGGERIAGTPDTIEGGVLDSDDQSLQAGTPPDGAHPNAAGIDFIVPRIVPQVVELGAAAGVINDSFGLADGSIELWFTPETIGGDQMLSKNAGGNVAGDIEILLDGNTVLAAIQNGTDTFPVTGGTVAAGENVHVVLTFGAGGLELFVDGASVASDAGFTGGLVGNVQELALGARVNGEVAFDGVIDEVAIYDRALTAGEIGRLFDAGEQGDTLIGTAAADTLIGGSDAEDLRGAGGDDIINGNGGDDTLRGGGGEDIARGGQGDDRFLGGGGADVLLGGPDNDTLRGMGGHDRIVGGGGNDLLQVEGGRDTLSGTGGADELLGGRARDSLSGGGGDDLLNGGPGRDQLNGGPDSDTFEIDRIGHGPDRIFDFEDGVGGDVLDLSAVLDFGENDNLDDFVRLDPVNNNANVEVDPNGGGDDFTTVFRLIGGADLDINALINDGNIDLGTPTS